MITRLFLIALCSVLTLPLIAQTQLPPDTYEYFDNKNIKQHVKNITDSTIQIVDYFENGLVRSIRLQVYTEADGLFNVYWVTTFHDNGRMQYMGNPNQDPEVQKKTYHPNGAMHFLIERVYRGAPDGYYYEYHDNGQIKTEGQYETGKKTGEWKHYNRSGEFMRVDKY